MESIKQRIEELKEQYDVVGVRRSDESDETIESRSTVWEDGDKLEEELIGLSTVGADNDWEEIIKDYHFKYIYLVVGDFAENGNDIGESVIIPEHVELIGEYKGE